MSTKQFTVRMESQGGAKVKTDLAGIGEAGRAAHDKISQGARESSQSTEQMNQEQLRAVRAFQQLKASIDPAYAAQLKYDKSVLQVQRATALGIASKEEEARVLQQLRAQHDQTIASMQKGVVQTTAIGKVSGASASQVANLGAQFNDIGVMLAAGQSPLQLAVQQGSQINQVFAQMGGGTAALRGVAAGVASMVNPMSLATIGIIAGGAALVQWGQSAIAARNETADMEKAVDNLLATVSEVSSYNETARQSLIELRKEFGDNAAAVRDNAQALRDLSVVKAVTALEDTVRALSGSVSEAIIEFDRLEGLTGRNAGPGGSIRSAQIAALAEEVGFTADEARRLREAFADLSAAEGLDGATASAQALYDQMIDIFGSAQDIPPELQEAARQALQAANAGYDLEAALNNASGAASNAAVSASGLQAQLAGATAQAAALIANLGMVPAAMAGLARDVVGQVEAMRVSNAALTDQLKNGTDARVAALRAERNAILNKMEVEGADMVAQADRIATMDAEISALETLVTENDRLTKAVSEAAKAKTGSAGASKASADAARSAVQQLQKQIELDRRLIGLADDMVAEIEARQRVEEALAQDKLNWNEQAIQGLTDQILLNQRLRDEAEQTSGVLRTVFDGLASGDIRSIGSGIMDMARGSFSDLLQTSFAKGGGGLKNVWESVTSGFTNIGANYRDAGGGLAGVGSAVSGVLEGIGAISSVVGLVQSFVGTTTKLTNALEGTLGIDGLLRGTEYDIKQKDNIFGSKTEKNSEEIFGSWAGLIAQDLDQEFRDMVQRTRDGIRDLGLEIDENFIYNFDVKFDESLPHEQLMERLRQELDAANDELLRTSLAAAGLARDGESGAQTLQALNTSLGTANASLRLLDQTLFDISAIGAGAARELVEVAGGLDAFSAKTTFVFDNFLTETERTARGLQIAVENMAAFEAQAGITLPETHAEFMALLDAQDLTTAAGRNLYAALLDVADEFVTVNGAAMDAATGLDAVSDAVVNFGQNQQALLRALRSAEQDVRDAFGAERDDVAEAYALQIAAAQASAQASQEQAQAALASAQERINLRQSIVDALERAYRDRRVLDALGEMQRISSGTAFLRAAVNAGGTSDLLGLSQALDAVADPSTALFNSFAEYAQDFNVNTNLIEELKEISDGQLTVEMRMLRAAEDAVDAIGASADRQVRALEEARDAQVAALNQQLFAILGLDESVMTVSQAIAALELARGDAGAVPSGDLGGSDADGNGFVDPGSPLWYARYRPQSIEGQINSAYNNILGRNVDAAGLGFYAPLVKADNGFGIAELEEDLRKNAASDTGVPAFASGGLHAGGWRMVGERGRELEYTGPSRIFSNSDTRALMDTRRIEELLLEAAERLANIEDHTRRTKQVAEQTYEDAQA